MEANKIYDCAIIGGGLAGLCLSIQLAQKGFLVVLMEKNSYPFHKVCGEYISLESWNFLSQLGIPLAEMNLPIIKKLQVTAENGFIINADLDLGGFGISRFTLDEKLAQCARQAGVAVLENTTAKDVTLENETYTITTNHYQIKSKLAFGSFGKINPSFISDKNPAKKGAYIGVKYHIKTDFPNNIIALHNFKDGYCGISKVDKETYCLCYLTTTKNLRENNNSISEMEKNVLKKNPYLKKIFSESTFLFDKPLAISQISFKKKKTFSNNLILLGDSAGAIAPLCGNGMSMAMRASQFLANYVIDYLENKISKNELLNNYEKLWNANFALRINTGFYLQKLLGKNVLTFISLKALNAFPSLFQRLIGLTHGKPF
ncbi:MAG: NAD(P)/FAD-dependent oxidoreductase [Bacteroidota bacterium]|jgi:flavin-dependent dehydrogenase